MKRSTITCRTCEGDGYHWTSRYGGNDPDVWRDGPCHTCDGSGDQMCEGFCGDQYEPAIALVDYPGAEDGQLALCRACLKMFYEEDADAKWAIDDRRIMLEVVCHEELRRI